MIQSELDFLNQLLDTPSPSGYEADIQKVVREFCSSFTENVTTDLHGNVTAVINPTGSPRIMLAGHCDQIGLMVRHIDDHGYIWVNPIGGWDIQMLIGQNMKIWTDSGPIVGVIARKPIHLLTPDERKTVPEMKHLWIDIGATDGDETSGCVSIGDPVTFDLGMRHLRNELAAAPGMDNKVGVWVVMNALQQVSESSPSAAVFAVSTVQEEVGLRGVRTSAFSIDPKVGIAVDVTHATDCPTIEEKQFGRVGLGDGPVVYRGPNINPAVFNLLKEQSQEHDIPIQINGLSKLASNDGNVLQVSRGGVATGLVTIPNRYMHSPVEVVSLADVENSAKLIAKFCLSIDSTTNFIP